MLYRGGQSTKKVSNVMSTKVYPYPVPNYCASTNVLISSLNEFCRIFNRRNVCNISSRNGTLHKEIKSALLYQMMIKCLKIGKL